MSTKQKARFIEKNPPIGKIDWVKHEILSRAFSNQEWRRLGACASEPETVKWIEEEIKAGDVFYDIGASIGAYSLIAAKNTNSSVTVYAFEPTASSFSSLVSNIALNHLGECVIPLNIALSDKTQFVRFVYGSLEAGATKHPGLAGKGERAGNEEVFTQPVFAWALDEFIERASLKPPTHIKIDVDGSEILVLRGALKILTSIRLRLVQVEVRKGDAGTEREVRDILESRGFKLVGRFRDDTHKPADLLFKRQQ
ncbi:MAG: FkbM family methyltransferase [bacterium]|nr:FkbM family methyltransferase [bacterium]